MIDRRELLHLLGSLPAAGIAFAQDAPTYKAEVDVVNVLATVRDRNGTIVNTLSKDDFTLEEEGRPQEIRYFSRQSDLPLTVGLLVDTSLSQSRLIAAERAAATQFFQQVLRPETDKAFVIKFDVEVTLLRDLTASRAALESALRDLDLPAPGSPRRPRDRGQQPRPTPASFEPQSRAPGVSWPPGLPSPNGGPYPGDPRRPGRYPSGIRPRVTTALYDAVYLAGEEILHKPTGRKAAIVISDGIDAGSKVTLDRAVASALRADTIIYTIRYFDPQFYTHRPPGSTGDNGADSEGRRTLESISSQTGGRLFEVEDEKALTEVFAQIQDELRNQYSLGYHPPKGRSGFRRILLKTHDNQLRVTTRAGYYTNDKRL